MFCRAAATFEGTNSEVISRPSPLSRRAAAMCSVEIANEVPNSTIAFARDDRASMYNNDPVSGDTARWKSFMSV